MSGLAFQIRDVCAEPYAVVPTLQFRLRLTGAASIRHLALNCQVRIEPERRRYSINEEDRLLELFGSSDRWGQTLKPFLWTQVSTVAKLGSGAEGIELSIPCTYDFEVTAARYLHALEGGDVPLRLLFSGTVFADGVQGLTISQIPWDREAAFRLPVQVWRDLMDQYFPGSGWLRLRRESLDALLTFKGRHALGTWDGVIETLIQRAEAT